MALKIEKSKDKVAIIVVGYNRMDGLKRLLNSVVNANYPDTNIPLVISIDCSNNTDVYNFARNFQWPHGPLYVNIQKERLGLKNHIFQCGDLTEYFKGVILLEDDIYVSPDFYNYTLAAIEKYCDEEKIAGISLYNEERNGYIGLPFQPLNNGYDVYAWQTISSWGEAWTDTMWGNFRKWLLEWDEDFDSIPMPSVIKTWSKAWSKYYYAYIISNDLYYLFPYCSLSTNFNDVGGENGGGGSLVQVSLQNGCRDYNMPDFTELVKYDVFQQNIELYEALNLSRKELCLDLYGKTYSDIRQKKRFILSINRYDYPILKSFALALRPIELNVIRQIEGKGIYLYDTCNANNKSQIGSYTNESTGYFLQGFNVKRMARYVMRYYWCAIKRKLYIK